MLEQWPGAEHLMNNAIINYWVFALLILFPFIKITKRANLPIWTAFSIFIPYIGMIVATGLIAHMKWEDQ